MRLISRCAFVAGAGFVEQRQWLTRTIRHSSGPVQPISVLDGQYEQLG